MVLNDFRCSSSKAPPAELGSWRSLFLCLNSKTPSADWTLYKCSIRSWRYTSGWAPPPSLLLLVKTCDVFCQNQHEDLKKQHYDLQDQHQAQGDDHNRQLDEHRERYDKLQQIKELEVSQLKGGKTAQMGWRMLALHLFLSFDLTK